MGSKCAWGNLSMAWAGLFKKGTALLLFAGVANAAYATTPPDTPDEAATAPNMAVTTESLTQKFM